PRVGSLFFSLCRLPPCPTPFPYATLFRSGVSGLVRAGALGMRAVLRGPVRAVVRVVARPAALLRALAAGRGVPAAPVQRGLQLGDRKSTRLNSSHVKSSYAVFCLKKKSKQ